ncbi:MAG: hypothetical protein U1A78_05975 [Polyangia bacterium]
MPQSAPRAPERVPQPRRGRTGGVVLGLCAALLAACSWIFDDTPPDLPLAGEPVDLSRLPKLNAGPARDVYLLRDGGGLPWAVIVEAATTDLTVPPLSLRDTIRMVRLAPPADAAAEEVLPARVSAVANRSVFILEPPVPPKVGELPDLMAPTTLVVARPGGWRSGPLMLPSGNPILSVSGNDAACVYVAQRPDAKLMYLLRSDGSYRRELPLPAGVDPMKVLEKARLSLLDDGSALLVQDAMDQVTLYGTQSETQVALGKQPRTFLFDREQRALLTCSDSGVLRVPLDGSAAIRLDSAPCSADILRLDGRQRGDSLLFKSGEALRQVPQLGGAPGFEVLAAPVGQLMALGPMGELLYSRDPPLRYGAGIGDGWLGERQIMERGRRPAWSGDARRIRWLEGAARSDNTGELTSLELATGAALTLARNTRTFSELSDGRVLAIANAAQRGPHNRLVVVDEAKQQARFVAASARDFIRLPGDGEVLLKVISGQFIDVQRVAIPPR